MQNFDLGIFILESYALYKRKHYKQSASFIENIIAKYRLSDNAYLHYLLALNYIHLGIFSSVQKEINTIKRIDSDSEYAAELEGYIQLKGAPLPEVPLVKYIELTEKYPNNKKFKNILNRLRNCENFEILQKSISLTECITVKKPSYKRSIINNKVSKIKGPFDRIYKLLVFILLIIVLFTAVFIIYKLSSGTFTINESINIGKNANFPDFYNFEKTRYPLIDNKKNTEQLKFYPNEDSLKKDLIEAEYLMKSGKYNEALIKYNNIFESNANAFVKEKASFYKSFINNIDPFERNSYRIDINEIVMNPVKYDGIVIDVSGNIINLKFKDNKTIIRLSGSGFTAEVYFDYLLNVEKDKNIKIKAVFKNNVNNNMIYLEGIKKY